MKELMLLEDERLDKVNEKITLIQKKNGLTFGTDAFLLASFMREQRTARAAELGTGTGIISLLCAARERFAHICAFEIQKDFYELTSRNINLNALEARISAYNADIRTVTAHNYGGEFDVVFSNPPYMLTNSGKPNTSEYKYIARHEVCGDINDFCAVAYRLLKHGGKFYCVWRPDRLVSLFSSMRANRLEPKLAVFVHGDTKSEPSMVLVSATKGGAEGMKILPSLFLHDDDTVGGTRPLSARAAKIYGTMSFWE